MESRTRSSRKSDGVLRLARDLRHSYEVGVGAMQEAMEAYDNAIGDRQEAAEKFLFDFINAKANFDRAEAEALAIYRDWLEKKYSA